MEILPRTEMDLPYDPAVPWIHSLVEEWRKRCGIYKRWNIIWTEKGNFDIYRKMDYLANVK